MALGQKFEFKTFGVRLVQVVQLVQTVFSLRKKVAVEPHAIRSEPCEARRLLAAGAGPLIWLWLCVFLDFRGNWELDGGGKIHETCLTSIFLLLEAQLHLQSCISSFNNCQSRHDYHESVRGD